MTTSPYQRSDSGPIPPGWPVPLPQELARSQKLGALIRQEIEVAGGVIPFSRFMELALYAPKLGYYSAAQPKFGETGDFVTAPELTPLFSRCVAQQVAQVLDQLDGGDVLEAGAGSGALAANALLELESLKQLPQHYFILELSAGLRALQQQTVQQRAPHLLDRVRWLDLLPETGFRGVILGNELLDAMPTTRFRVSEKQVFEQCVRDNAGFVFCERLADTTIAAHVAALGLGSDYTSEINLRAQAWLRSFGTLLEQGLMLLLDYGFPRAEFYHPQRHRGTLMCHYRHRAHHDPLILVGLQDITAHVDFTAIAEAGVDAGLTLYGYTSQAAFLIGCGITEMAPDHAELRPAREQAQAITKLTAPQEMGELVKAIALGRNVKEPLRGFVVQDRRGRL